MEQVDGVLISILTSVGCRLGENVTSLSQFDAEILINATTTLLKAIDPSQEFKKHGSGTMGRFRSGQALSQKIQEMGYPSEVGPTQFVTPNEADTRDVLKWLVDRLPQSGSGNADSGETNVLSGSELVGKQIQDALSSWSKERYTFLSTARPRYSFRTTRLAWPTEGGRMAESSYLPWVCGQPWEDSYLVPSLLERNATELLAQQKREESLAGKSQSDMRSSQIFELVSNVLRNEIAATEAKSGRGSSYRSTKKKGGTTHLGLQTQFTQDPKKVSIVVTDSGTVVVDESGQARVGENDEDEEERRQNEINGLRARIEKLSDKLRRMQTKIEQEQSGTEQQSNELMAEEKKSEELRNEFNSKKRALQMLENPHENMKKLRQIIDDKKAGIVRLGQEWERYRTDLIGQYRDKKRAQDARKNQAQEMYEEIQRMRKEMKVHAKEIREKDELHKRLVNDLSKLPKSISRQKYVDRILGIVRNLEHQRADIRNILTQVVDLQREANKLTEQSKRSFSMTDDAVFQTAQTNTDPSAKAQLNQCYRCIVRMRENFDTMIEVLRQIGNTENDIRDVEYQIDALEEKVKGLPLKSVKKNLDEVNEDNTVLTARLKEMRKQLKASRAQQR